MSAADKQLMPPQRGTQSVDRTLALLRHTALHHADGIDLQALAQTCALDRTTAYRLLKALVRAGLLTLEPRTHLYRLGEESLVMGLHALQRPPPLERCIPLMKALARRVMEPVYLVVRTGDHSRCLHLEAGPRPVTQFNDKVGSQRLLGLGMPSFALLSGMEDADIVMHYERHAYEYQSHRLSLSRVWRWVHQTRQNGYALICAQGLTGVGLSISLGLSGEAALGIVGPASRLSRARGVEVAAMVSEEIRQWSS